MSGRSPPSHRSTIPKTAKCGKQDCHLTPFWPNTIPTRTLAVFHIPTHITHKRLQGSRALEEIPRGSRNGIFCLQKRQFRQRTWKLKMNASWSMEMMKVPTGILRPREQTQYIFPSRRILGLSYQWGRKGKQNASRCRATGAMRTGFTPHWISLQSLQRPRRTGAESGTLTHHHSSRLRALPLRTWLQSWNKPRSFWVRPWSSTADATWSTWTLVLLRSVSLSTTWRMSRSNSSLMHPNRS